jgi:hypothetical protein
VPRLHSGWAFARKTSDSSGLIQNLEPTWQLFGKMSIFYEGFGSSMPSLSLTLNPAAAGNPEPVNGYKIYSLNFQLSEFVLFFKSKIINQRSSLNHAKA